MNNTTQQLVNYNNPKTINKMKTLNQKTLRESAEIFNELKTIISNANSKIEVVSAWFTDPELLDLLIKKQRAGVKVSVVISDQKDNNKLPFTTLVENGGEVKRVKKTGYGMMHQKFCIVDDNILVHGSYNWTINARKNNDESVIITNHDQTVKEMSEIFKQLQSNATDEKPIRKNVISRILGSWKRKNTIKANSPVISSMEESETTSNTDQSNGYKAILKQLIESELANFDKEELKDIGFENSKNSHGDHEMLKIHLDALYASFLNDINLSDTKLKALKTKIELERKNAISQKDKYNTTEKNSIECVYENKLNQRLNELDRIKTEIESKYVKITSIEVQSSTLKDKIAGLKESLNGLSMKYKPLEIKQYELFGFSFLSIISFVAIFLFYGSALYILRYSTADANDALDLGLIPVTPGFFDDQAFIKAWLKPGWMAITLICSFWIVPVVLSVFMIYNKRENSKVKNSIGLAGILIVDTLLAAIVSKNVHNVNYLMGDVIVDWSPNNLVFDMNFWSVFLVGALVVLLFKFCLSKVKAYLDIKAGDVENYQLKQEEKNIHELISSNEEDINQLEQNATEIKMDIKQDESTSKTIQRDIDLVPNEKERELKVIDSYVSTELNSIDDYCNLVIANLESGKLEFSIHDLKERVSYFLSGWNNFLHTYFAEEVAKEKSNQMNNEKEKWMTEKSHLSSIKKAA